MGQHTQGFPCSCSSLLARAEGRWQSPGGDIKPLGAIFSQPAGKVGQEQVHELFCHCWACLGRFLSWMSCSRSWTCGLWLLCNLRTPIPFPAENLGLKPVTGKDCGKYFPIFKKNFLKAASKFWDQKDWALLLIVILPLQEKEVSKTHLIHWQHSI